jgi:site-specific DNA recombinase
LRDLAATRELDLVLSTAPDRLARNYVHQVLLLEALEKYGGQVQVLDRPMRRAPHDPFLLQIRGAVAEYERSLIPARMRRGRQRKRQAGLLLPWTRSPYGYRGAPERPRDPAGVRLEEVEAVVVRERFAWYAGEAPSLFSLARRLQARGIRTPNGSTRWNLARVRAVLTNPAYSGQVSGTRWHRRGTLERRSATVPSKPSAYTRVEAPREEWTFGAHIPALLSQDVFAHAQRKLTLNRRFARRHNTAHPYLLRALVSCGGCGLACLGRSTIKGHRYYSGTGKLQALTSHREQKCPSRLSPALPLDDLVWAEVGTLLPPPTSITQALERAHGGNWAPQELHARREGLRHGQVSLTHHLERLPEAYLASVVSLDEYRRRRQELERRAQELAEQQRRLEAQVDRRQELAGLASGIEDFCRRVQGGLTAATFAQKRQSVELLIDRVIVTDGDVEIRYVVPTDPRGEQLSFCHLR